MTFYQKILKEIFPGQNPRHLEAYLRLRFGTLDSLSREDMREEGEIAIACIQEDAKAAEDLAKSFGL